MGNSNKEKEIRNRHAEEIARIEAMNEENERQAAIKRLALENGYKLDLKRIQNYADEARMRHEEILMLVRIIMIILKKLKLKMNNNIKNKKKIRHMKNHRNKMKYMKMNKKILIVKNIRKNNLHKKVKEERQKNKLI